MLPPQVTVTGCTSDNKGQREVPCRSSEFQFPSFLTADLRSCTYYLANVSRGRGLPCYSVEGFPWAAISLCVMLRPLGAILISVRSILEKLLLSASAFLDARCA